MNAEPWPPRSGSEIRSINPVRASASTAGRMPSRADDPPSLPGAAEPGSRSARRSRLNSSAGIGTAAAKQDTSRSNGRASGNCPAARASSVSSQVRITVARGSSANGESGAGASRLTPAAWYELR